MGRVTVKYLQFLSDPSQHFINILLIYSSMKDLDTQPQPSPHKLLSSTGFLTSDTFLKSTPIFPTLRSTLKSTQKTQSPEFFQKCLQILQTNSHKPKYMVTQLIFIHLLLQTQQHKTDELLSLLKEEINYVLRRSQEYCRDRHTGAVFRYALSLFTEPDQMDKGRDDQDGYKQEISVGQQQNNKRIGSGSSIMSEISGNFSRKTSISSWASDKKNQYVSEKQVLCEKLIQPYACYLLKKCTSDFQQKHVETLGDDIYFWHIINQLKNLFKITQNYYIILRYYDRKYQKLIINLTNLLSYQIHKCYPKITKQILSKLHQTIKQLHPILPPPTNDTDSNDPTSTYQSITNKQNISIQSPHPCSLESINNNLYESKLLLKQISEINDNLISLYFNKYLTASLKGTGIKMPDLMNLDTVDCQIVYFYIKDREERVEREAKKGGVKKMRSHSENMSGFRKMGSIGMDKQPDCETMTPNRTPLRKNSTNTTKLQKNSSLITSQNLIYLQIDETQDQ